MKLDKKNSSIIQIEKTIEKIKPVIMSITYRGNYHTPFMLSEANTLMETAIEHFSPPGSIFRQKLRKIQNSQDYLYSPETAESICGILTSLKDAYENELIDTFEELVHADLFNDFLEMAEELLNKKYLGPAAVLAGCVLEEHVRNLCVNNCVDKEIRIKKRNKNKPISFSDLNVGLKKKGIYNESKRAELSSYYSRRTDGAHKQFDKNDKKFEQDVSEMIKGIRRFISEY